LVGFSREHVFPFEFFELSIMAGRYPGQKIHHGKVLADRSTLGVQCHPREYGTE